MFEVSALRIQPVRDWELAARFIADSWRDNQESSLDYTPELIEWLAKYPGRLPVLTPSLFIDGQLAAFVMGFPRIFEVEGQIRNILLMTFLTVASAFKGRGLGRRVWAECLHQALEAGYDGSLHFCVEGNVSNTATVAGARLAGLDARRIFTVTYLMSLLRKADSVANDSPAGDVGTLIRFASTIRAVPLSRVWSEPEMEWQLQRPGAISAFGAEGALIGSRMHVADAAHTEVCFIDDIFWASDSEVEQSRLLSRFLRRAANTSKLVAVPVQGYADMQAFTAAHFRKSPRVLHTYLTCFRELPCPLPVSKIYSEVL